MTDEQRIALYNQISIIITNCNAAVTSFTWRGEGPANEPFRVHERGLKLAAMEKIDALMKEDSWT